MRTRVQGAACPAQLEAVIQKCLSKRPELRYQTTAELAEDLRRIESNEMPQAVSDMMGRKSDGIPQDYLRSASGPITSAATNPALAAPPKKGIPVWVWPVTLFAAVAIVGSGVFYKRFRDASVQPSDTTAKPTESVATAASAATSASAPVTVAPAPSLSVTVSSAAPASATVRVVLKIVPDKATVKRDGKALASPVLDLKPGEKASLEVSAPGYVTKNIDVADDKPEVDIELAATGNAGAAQPAHPVGQPVGQPGTRVIPTW